MAAWLASSALPALRLLDPETAHRISLLALRAGIAGHDSAPDEPVLSIQAFGRTLRNPFGLAAGFDKNAEALHGLARLGFGFLEAGTVTPRPQNGNPKPRLFRLIEDAAVINRMGFNNAGLAAFLPALAGAPRALLPIGANIGINKEGADPQRDYPALVKAVAPHADYITINISSPNTPGLRDLQNETLLAGILDAIAASAGAHPALFVKIAPDLADEALPGLIALCIARGVAGLIISNTTITRPGLRSANAVQTGGLSGAPLFAASTRMLARAHLLAQGRLTLIGVGGIATPAQALDKILAGASLLQIYTSLAYQGPAIIPRLKRGLAALLTARKVEKLADAVGADAERLAQ